MKKIVELKNQHAETLKAGNDLRCQLGAYKARRISLLLLDALKARDKNAFLENVLREYVGMGAPVPAVLLSASSADEDDFLKLGYNFVLGLNSAQEGEDKKKP